jgi:hypothetical protein
MGVLSTLSKITSHLTRYKTVPQGYVFCYQAIDNCYQGVGLILFVEETLTLSRTDLESKGGWINVRKQKEIVSFQ